MEFSQLLFPAIVSVVGLVLLATIIPRWLNKKRLQQQLAENSGHVFTPDAATWNNYLARTRRATPVVSLVAYVALVAVVSIFDSRPLPLAVSVGVGCLLLLRYLLLALPPTFAVTGKGIFIFSWQPVFPLAPFGSGTVYIPWQAVSVCEIQEQYFTVLTERKEAQVVYPAEAEDKICRFVDLLLRQRGYQLDNI